jgi:hypothetical protein
MTRQEKQVMFGGPFAVMAFGAAWAYFNAESGAVIVACALVSMVVGVSAILWESRQ